MRAWKVAQSAQTQKYPFAIHARLDFFATKPILRRKRGPSTSVPRFVDHPKKIQRETAEIDMDVISEAVEMDGIETSPIGETVEMDDMKTSHPITPIGILSQGSWIAQRRISVPPPAQVDKIL